MPGPMPDSLRAIERALRGGGWWWGLGVSVALALGSFALVTAIVVSWPPDHFTRPGGVRFWEHRHPIVRMGGLVGKNAGGALLVALGAVMALPGVPGQGFLTMLIGLTLIDFPGKRRLERRLVGRPAIKNAIDRLRARFGRPALELVTKEAS